MRVMELAQASDCCCCGRLRALLLVGLLTLGQLQQLSGLEWPQVGFEEEEHARLDDAAQQQQPYWRSPGCFVVGHTRVISVPGCVKFNLTTSACRGFCVSFSLPTGALGAASEQLALQPQLSELSARLNQPPSAEWSDDERKRLVTSVSQCCSMKETEQVVANVRCVNGMRRLVFHSAKRCECNFCKRHFG